MARYFFLSFCLSVVWRILYPVGVVGQGERIESRISDEAFFVTRINVEQLISQQNKKPKELAPIRQFFSEESGIDLMTIKSITFQNFNPIPEDSEFQVMGFAMTFDFNKEFDKDLFLSKVSRGKAEEMEFMGKTYLKPENNSDPFFYFPNKTSFTMATPNAILSIIKAESQKPGTMARRIASAPENSEISVAFQSSEAFQLQLDSFSTELGLASLPIDPVKSLKTVNSGFGHVELMSSTPLFLQLKCKNKAAASQFKGMAKVLLETARISLTQAKEEMNKDKARKKEEDAPVDSMPMALARRVSQLTFRGVQIGEKALKGAKATSNENLMTLKINHMGGLPEVNELVADLFTLFVGTTRTLEIPDQE